MACFLVPGAEAIVVSAVNHVLKTKQAPSETVDLNEANISIHGESTLEKLEKIPFTQKLSWLSKLLWGGSTLLAFEHVWHGEVVPFFPFLTAAGNPADAAEMLHEMSTVGTTMAVIVSLVWVGMVVATSKMQSSVMAKDALKK